MKTIESLAMFLNEISQTEIAFMNCSKKIQDSYRQKASWIIKHLASLDAEKGEYCKWETDEDGVSESYCGLTWQCIDGTPEENQMSFCPKCGKPIRIKEPS